MCVPVSFSSPVSFLFPWPHFIVEEIVVQRGPTPCLRSHSPQGSESGFPSPSFWFQSPMSSAFGYTVSQAGRVTNARRCGSRRGVCADSKVGVLGLAGSRGSLRRWAFGWKGSEWKLAERSNGEGSCQEGRWRLRPDSTQSASYSLWKQNNAIALPSLTRGHGALRVTSSGTEGQARQTDRKIHSKHSVEGVGGCSHLRGVIGEDLVFELHSE